MDNNRPFNTIPNYDAEEITEMEKALKIAYQYRTNTLRIRRLLSNNPATTWDNCLINWSTGKMLINPNPDIPYIDDSLIIS